MKSINFHRVWAVMMRHMMSWPRSLERLADAFWWPTFNLFLWGLVTTYLQSSGGSYQFLVSLFLGGVIMWVFVYRSQEELGLILLQEAWDRNLLNMFSSPLTIWEFTIAGFLLSMLKLILSVSWMILLAILLFHFNLFEYGLILVPYAALLLAVGGIMGIVINGLIIQFGYRIQVFAWSLILVLQPFSGVFYPIESLPSWMREIAKFVPTSYVFEGMRTILKTGVVDYRGLMIAFALSCLYFVLAIWFFVRSFQRARESGALMKFS